MRKRKKKNEMAGIVIGPAIVFFALAALWKNETRYDYYKAARSSAEISVFDDATDQQIISYTGAMDKSLSLNDKYIQSLLWGT